MAEEHGGTKVHGNDGAKAAGDKPVGKDGSWIEKHKALAYGGMALILVVLFLFLRKSGSASSSTAAQNPSTNSSVDPATGYLYGSPADLAALGGSGLSGSTPGPPGPAGPAGPAGGTTTSTPTLTQLEALLTPGTSFQTAGGSQYTVGSNGAINSGMVDLSTTVGPAGYTNLAALAKYLGIQPGALAGSNAAAQAAIKNPNQRIASGDKFTYQKKVV